jgi:hypothetical protein
MKQCKHFQNLIPLYITNDLSEHEKPLVESHIIDCEKCSQFAKEIGIINSAIAKGKVEVSPSYGAELVVNINKKIEKRAKKKKRLLVTAPAIGIATLVLIVVALLFLGNGTIQNNSINSYDDFFSIFHLGYFAENKLLEDEILNLVEIPEINPEVRGEAVGYLIENSRGITMEEYLTATSELDNSEFNSLIVKVASNIR